MLDELRSTLDEKLAEGRIMLVDGRITPDVGRFTLVDGRIIPDVGQITLDVGRLRPKTDYARCWTNYALC